MYKKMIILCASFASSTGHIIKTPSEASLSNSVEKTIIQGESFDNVQITPHLKKEVSKKLQENNYNASSGFNIKLNKNKNLKELSSIKFFNNWHFFIVELFSSLPYTIINVAEKPNGTLYIFPNEIKSVMSDYLLYDNVIKKSNYIATLYAALLSEKNDSIRVINSVADIPFNNKSKFTANKFNSLISPPILTLSKERTYLNFYTWNPIGGALKKITIEIYNNKEVKNIKIKIIDNCIGQYKTKQ